MLKRLLRYKVVFLLGVALLVYFTKDKKVPNLDPALAKMSTEDSEVSDPALKSQKIQQRQTARKKLAKRDSLVAPQKKRTPSTAPMQYALHQSAVSELLLPETARLSSAQLENALYSVFGTSAAVMDSVHQGVGIKRTLRVQNPRAGLAYAEASYYLTKQGEEIFHYLHLVLHHPKQIQQQNSSILLKHVTDLGGMPANPFMARSESFEIWDLPEEEDLKVFTQVIEEERNSGTVQKLALLVTGISARGH